MSNTFSVILRLAQKGLLDNEKGFRVIDVIKAQKELRVSTVITFLPKHAKTSRIYFERINNMSGLYRIRNEYYR